MKLSLHQWIKANNTIFVNAGSLVGTSAVTSGLGFVYWWLAARQFPPEAVGLASAAISAMTLLGTLSILGLGTLLVGELPRQIGKEASLISSALVLVGGIGGCLGIGFAIFAPFVSTNLLSLRGNVADIMIFACGVSLTAIALVLDQALIGLLRGELQFWRNALFAMVKLVALFVAGFWLSQKVGLTIYVTWTIGSAFSLLALAGLAILKRWWSGRIYLPHWELLRRQGPAALQHHALNLTLLAPSLLLPLVVTILLSATANAWFYVSMMLANFVFIVPSALTLVLYATSSAQPAELSRKIRMTLSITLVTSIVANCVFLLGAKQILGLFGPSYAKQAVWCLQMLGLAAFPLIIRSHYLAVCRIQNRVAWATLLMVIGGAFELGGAALGAYIAGLSGLSFGWFTILCIEAGFIIRPMWKILRNTGSSANTARSAVQDNMCSIDTYEVENLGFRVADKVGPEAQ